MGYQTRAGARRGFKPMIGLLAMSALSIQFETGVNYMQRGQDDLYYEEQLPHSIQFTTPVYGVGLRFDVSRLQLTLGYRDLGHQEINATLLSDATYFHCRDVGHNCASLTPIEQWATHMHTQQTYVELGYAFRVGHWRLVPSAGVALNQERIDVAVSYLNGYGSHDGEPHAPAHVTGGSQRVAAPFGGLSLQRGSFGVGVFILDTQPQFVPSPKPGDWYPGTGNTSYLLRMTYNFNLIGGVK
jgi:hypothetical protein